MISRTIARLMLPTMLLAFSGCSALFMGSNQDLTVTSNPPQAEILINSIARDVTPSVLSVGRNQRVTVTVRKDGYYPASQLLDQKYTLAGWLDIIGSPALIPMAGLAAPGRFRQSPDVLHFDMRPKGVSSDGVLYMDKAGNVVTKSDDTADAKPKPARRRR